MTEGVRYPTFAFITGGVGQADEGIPPQPFETFCYDSALMQAKIENFNVVPYTSVLPKELFGKIVPLNDQIVKQFKHGAVLEVIMAGRVLQDTRGRPQGHCHRSGRLLGKGQKRRTHRRMGCRIRRIFRHLHR